MLVADAVLVGVAGLVGLVVGSFLNVVAHRVPAGESVVHPRSRCPGCQAPVAARDNIPVVSWLLLRGRCRSCGARISVRYPLIELGTGAAFAAVAAWQGPHWSLLPLLYLAAISIVLAAIDLDVRRLPDAIVLPSYPVLLLLLVPDTIADGSWWPLARAAIGAVALFAFYDIAAFLYPRGNAMGGGDIKLAGVLGMAMAWFGWRELVTGAFAGFLLGGLGSLVLLLGGSGWKAKIPFGPYMIAGAWLGLVFGGEAAQWYLDATGISALIPALS